MHTIKSRVSEEQQIRPTGTKFKQIMSIVGTKLRTTKTMFRQKKKTRVQEEHRFRQTRTKCTYIRNRALINKELLGSTRATNTSTKKVTHGAQKYATRGTGPCANNSTRGAGARCVTSNKNYP